MIRTPSLLTAIAIACCVPLALVHSFLPGARTHHHPASSVRRQVHAAAQSSAAVSFDSVIPRIQETHLQELQDKGYVIIPNFLPPDLQAALRQDVITLRDTNHFRIAKIGQDSTNALNQDIRVAETCFLGPSKLSDVPSDARNHLYSILDQVRSDLPQPLDPNLTELLYAYYPKGGFYRRHVDAMPGSASVLRSISLLCYLNQDWTGSDGGQLLLHRDTGGDVLPGGEAPNFVEVQPEGGTLVLFQSLQVPHEVLDAHSERLAVVGWYNRPVTPADISALGGSVQPILLAVAAGLVTVGLINLIQ